MTVTILGNNSALPAYDRHPTAQVVALLRTSLLLDCGEGTQLQMIRFGIRWSKISHIFISHLHGDHFYGLPGLLNSMSLLGRTAPLFISGPPQLEGIMMQLREAAGRYPFSYELTFMALPEGGGLLVDNEQFSVRCFPVEHRIPCWGFLVEEKSPGRRLLPEKAEAAGIPVSFYARLKKGEDFVSQSGERVPAESVTEPGLPRRRYAYCADTRYTESFLETVRGVDLMYHESTFLEVDANRAAERFHSTAKQAAALAQKAGVGKLLLGHYSSRYENVTAFEEEAREVFAACEASVEGRSYEV